MQRVQKRAGLNKDERAAGKEQLSKLCGIATFCERYLKIVTKAGDLETIVFNPIQVILLQLIAWCWLTLTPCTVLEPKSRQLGSSTFWEAILFARMWLEDHFRAVVVAHLEKPAHEIFQMCLMFEEELKLPGGLVAEVKARSKSELSFKHGSRMIVMTIGTGGGMGRGFTFRGFHGSEVAFWKNRVDPWASWKAINKAIAKTLDRIVAFETSPDGPDHFFYFQCEQARQGKNNWIPVFLPWYLLPEYSISKRQYLRESRAAAIGQEVSLELTPDEVTLVAEVAAQRPVPGEEWMRWPAKLTLEQLLWRRVMIANECGGDPDDFDKEFPSTYERAFRSKDMTLFPAGLIARYFGMQRPPIQTGVMRGKPEEPFLLEMDPKDTPWTVKLWEKLDPDGEYVVGADPSEGLKGGDPAAAYVLRVDRGQGQAETVAALHGWLDPDVFGSQLNLLGRWFNNARMAVEVNKSYETVRTLRKLKYPNLYWYRDPRNPKTRNARPGWYTGDGSRKLVLAVLKAMARDGDLLCYDVGLPMEMQTFVPGPKGKWEAKPGATDDRILAMAIACWMADLRDTRARRKKPKGQVLREEVSQTAYEAYQKERKLAQLRKRNSGAEFFSFS